MMRLERGLIFWSASGIASGLLAATAWAQMPLPSTGPAPVVSEPPGRIRGAWRHTFRTLQDNFIGYPEEFIEPPIGFYVRENNLLMRAKADPHRFTLYRSDFLAGTDRLSPLGASRFNLLAARLRAWPGPVLIEWSPDTPGLAEARRMAVLALLQNTGAPMIPERVVIGPSTYPGMLGTDAANNYGAMITRDQLAPTNYSLTPSQSATFSSAGGAP
jgi:hypothetical protein